MIDFFKRAYNAIVEWVERGDLVPLIILVSIPHYINVMGRFDYWGVAVAMGILTDLGHYRTILVYLKSTVGRFASLFWMSVLTFISYGFHVGFYTLGNFAPQPWPWILGAVPPVLIFAMAYISKREKWYIRGKTATAGSAEQPTIAKWDIRKLDPAAKLELKGMTTKQIMAKYPGLSERSASNWKRKVKE